MGKLNSSECSSDYCCHCVQRECVCAAPLHALHQCNLVRRRGDVEGSGLALVNAMFDPIYSILLFDLHRVAQTQRPEKQLLVLLQWTADTRLPSFARTTNAYSKRVCTYPGCRTWGWVDHVHTGSSRHHLQTYRPQITLGVTGYQTQPTMICTYGILVLKLDSKTWHIQHDVHVYVTGTPLLWYLKSYVKRSKL